MTDTPATNRGLGWVVGLSSTAYFMVVLDSPVVITALPLLQRDQPRVRHYGLTPELDRIDICTNSSNRLIAKSLCDYVEVEDAIAPEATQTVLASTVRTSEYRLTVRR